MTLLKKALISLFLFLFLLTTACRPNQPSETSALTPTAIPPSLPTATPTSPALPNIPSPTSRATEIPLPSATPPIVLAPTFELASDPFTHPEGLFSLTPPLGWTLETHRGTASFTSPNGHDFLTLEVTNTGYPLDPQAFTNFINGREANLFTPYAAYQPGSPPIDTSTTTVTKTLIFQDTPQTVLTSYLQTGQAILALDFWTDSASFPSNEPLIRQIIQSLTLDETAATELAIYPWVFTFTGPTNLFTLEIPTSWQPEIALNDLATIHTFIAPDHHARLQSIVFDDGNLLTLSQAGQFALSLLQRYYASDVEVLGDTRLDDGSERLTWISEDGGYRGVSFFEVRGTTFLLLTVQWEDAYVDLYRPLLDEVVRTYAVP